MSMCRYQRRNGFIVDLCKYHLFKAANTIASISVLEKTPQNDVTTSRNLFHESQMTMFKSIERAAMHPQLEPFPIPSHSRPAKSTIPFYLYVRYHKCHGRRTDNDTTEISVY